MLYYPLVVALRKLAMPAAGGVPCVGSTFFIPILERKFYMPKTFFTYEQQSNKLQQEKGLIISDIASATEILEHLSYYSLT